ncbi:MAG: hypothetical protein EAZ53_08075 [Bacteroidetes bacterium]|nr:MAG: hypothetical protein EAZ53_08075 [Bacteroidota bacterium]
MLKEKFKIKSLTVVVATGRIEYDEEIAAIKKVHDDDEYEFDAVTCAARPVEFSIINNLYKLDKQEVVAACEDCNFSRRIGVLTTDKYHLILSPFVERHTFFGKEQAAKLTADVIDECQFLGCDSLRITQFAMMRGQMPFYDQFKGILETLYTDKESPITLVYFDVPEKFFDEVCTLFGSYQKMV